jgi:hypothetical protein
MSEHKKLWAVRKVITLDTRQGLEDALNSLADDGYDVHDINYEKSLVIGYLRDDVSLQQRLDEAVDSSLGVKPAETPAPTTTVMSEPSGRVFMINQESSPSMFLTKLFERMGAISGVRMPKPAEAPTEVPAAPAEEIPSTKTVEFLTHLRDVSMVRDHMPDSAVVTRVEHIIAKVFKGVPREEVKSSLAYIKHLHADHTSDGECDGSCAGQKTIATSLEKLQAYLEANPAN